MPLGPNLMQEYEKELQTQHGQDEQLILETPVDSKGKRRDTILSAIVLLVIAGVICLILKYS